LKNKKNGKRTSKRLGGGQICTLIVGILASIISWILPVDFPIGEEVWLPLVTAGVGVAFSKWNQRAANQIEE